MCQADVRVGAQVAARDAAVDDVPELLEPRFDDLIAIGPRELGLLAGVIGSADAIPYVRDVHRGSTRPHRGTWLIWSVLAIIAFLSQRADGATWSLVMVAGQAVLTSVIFVLPTRRREGGVSPGELVMIGLAGAGVAGWLIPDEPVVATACVVAADLIGVALMVPKTWRDPASETLITFVLGGLAGALAAGAVGELDASLLLYPVYYCVGNAAIALLIVSRAGSARPYSP